MGKGYDECCEFWAEKKKKKAKPLNNLSVELDF